MPRTKAAPAHLQPHRVDLLAGEGPHEGDPGSGSWKAALGMAFKLIETAQGRWHRVNAPQLVALVATGAKFVNGKLVERVDEEVAA